MQNAKVTFIIPALNEEASIGKVIHEIQNLPVKSEIIVADSHSRDKTESIVRGLGYRVIQAERGKGSAVLALIPLIETPYAVMVDADFTYSLRSVPQMLDMLRDCDVVVGWRKYREPSAMKPLNIFGNVVISGIASACYGQRIHDVCSGLWAFRTPILKSLPLTSRYFTLEVDLLATALEMGMRIAEVPIVYRPRIGGKPKFVVGKDWLINVGFILSKRFGKEVIGNDAVITGLKK